MTQREFFNAITTGTLTVKVKGEDGKQTEVSTPAYDNGYLIPEIVEFAQSAIVKIDNKNASRSKSLTETQKFNIELRSIITDVMSDGEKRTAKMIADIVESIDSTQKASALLKQLVDEGVLVATTEKFGGSSTKVKVYVKV